MLEFTKCLTEFSIANREDPGQTASSEAVVGSGSALFFLGFLGSQLVFEILELALLCCEMYIPCKIFEFHTSPSGFKLGLKVERSDFSLQEIKEK